MKHDPGSNYEIAEALAAKSYTAGAQNSAAVDHSKLPGASYLISVGTVGSSATVNAKVQHSPDNSTWTDEVAGAGNDTAITEIDAAGNAQLNVPNPRARYTRVVVTVATAACVVGVVSVAGPKLLVEPAATT